MQLGTQSQPLKHSSMVLLRKMWNRDREQRKGHFKANHWPQDLHGDRCSVPRSWASGFQRHASRVPTVLASQLLPGACKCPWEPGLMP